MIQDINETEFRPFYSFIEQQGAQASGLNIGSTVSSINTYVDTYPDLSELEKDLARIMLLQSAFTPTGDIQTLIKNHTNGDLRFQVDAQYFAVVSFVQLHRRINPLAYDQYAARIHAKNAFFKKELRPVGMLKETKKRFKQKINRAMLENSAHALNRFTASAKATIIEELVSRPLNVVVDVSALFTGGYFACYNPEVNVVTLDSGEEVSITTKLVIKQVPKRSRNITDDEFWERLERKSELIVTSAYSFEMEDDLVPLYRPDGRRNVCIHSNLFITDGLRKADIPVYDCHSSHTCSGTLYLDQIKSHYESKLSVKNTFFPLMELLSGFVTEHFMGKTLKAKNSKRLHTLAYIPLMFIVIHGKPVGRVVDPSSLHPDDVDKIARNEKLIELWWLAFTLSFFTITYYKPHFSTSACVSSIYLPKMFLHQMLPPAPYVRGISIEAPNVTVYPMTNSILLPALVGFEDMYDYIMASDCAVAIRDVFTYQRDLTIAKYKRSHPDFTEEDLATVRHDPAREVFRSNAIQPIRNVSITIKSNPEKKVNGYLFRGGKDKTLREVFKVAIEEIPSDDNPYIITSVTTKMIVVKKRDGTDSLVATLSYSPSMTYHWAQYDDHVMDVLNSNNYFKMFTDPPDGILDVL